MITSDLDCDFFVVRGVPATISVRINTLVRWYFGDENTTDLSAL